MHGSEVSEELVAQLMDRQQDEPADESVIHDADADEDEAPTEFREEVVMKFLAMFRRAFSRRNEREQIISLLRLGEEFLALPSHLANALVLFNASAALCCKYANLPNVSMVFEALRWHVPLALRRAGKKVRFVLGEEDDFSIFQKRHQMLAPKMVLDDELFPEETIANTLNEIFESDWTGEEQGQEEEEEEEEEEE